MRIFLLSIIVTIGTLLFGQAQDIVFQQQLSRDTVLYGNYIELKYTIENVNGDFQAPDFEGFSIVSGPNVSSQFTMINGAITQSSSYSYYLRPLEEGIITIGSAHLENGEDLWSTESMTITVLPNPDGTIQNNRGYGWTQKIVVKDTVATQKDSLQEKLKNLKVRKI